MIIYGLKAFGSRRNFPSNAGTIFSKKVFLSKESAEAYAPTFLNACMKSGEINDLDEDAKVSVFELELEENEIPVTIEN